MRFPASIREACKDLSLGSSSELTHEQRQEDLTWLLGCSTETLQGTACLGLNVGVCNPSLVAGSPCPEDANAWTAH